MESDCPPAHCCLVVVEDSSKDDLVKSLRSDAVYYKALAEDANSKLAQKTRNFDALVSLIEVENAKREFGYDIIITEHYTLLVPLQKQQGK